MSNFTRDVVTHSTYMHIHVYSYVLTNELFAPIVVCTMKLITIIDKFYQTTHHKKHAGQD